MAISGLGMYSGKLPVPLAVQMYSGYDDYQAKTSREIPVVILAPAAP